MANANIKAVITADDRASSVLRGFSKNIEGLGSQAMQVAKRITQIGVAALAAGAILGIKTAAELESARQGFITLLGSAEKADKTLERIKKEAARTPFEIVGLTQATQLLSTVTKDGDRALDFILDIGEGLAAMGRGQAELDRISVNLQQIAATGRAYGIDIRQFAFAGIPIYEMLQEETKLAGEALTDFIETGGVTFAMLEKMFQASTEEGGRFFGAFKNQLGTFNQQWSNLKDTFAITAADIVVQTGLFQGLKDGMKLIGEWIVANREQIIAFFKGLADKAVELAKKFAAFIKENWPEIKQTLTTMGELAWDIVKGIADLIGWVKKLSDARLNLHGYLGPLGVLYDTVKGILSLFGLLKSEAGSIAYQTKNINITDYMKSISPGRNASGTSHWGGGMTWVGEEGKELVNLPRGSSITPANQSKGAMGNTTINISVQAGAYMGNPSDARKYAQMILESMKEIAGAKNLTPSQLLGGV